MNGQKRNSNSHKAQHISPQYEKTPYKDGESSDTLMNNATSSIEELQREASHSLLAANATENTGDEISNTTQATSTSRTSNGLSYLERFS